MKELGFFMDDNGEIIYYGEWAEQIDKHTRNQVHETSFIDDVESTKLFKLLNLEYNPETGIYGKGILFALQGMVTMLNLTSNGNSQFIMYTPQELTENQKNKFTDLYPLLSSFENATIVVPKTIQTSIDDEIHSVDTYYKINNISKQNARLK